MAMKDYSYSDDDLWLGCKIESSVDIIDAQWYEQYISPIALSGPPSCKRNMRKEMTYFLSRRRQYLLRVRIFQNPAVQESTEARNSLFRTTIEMFHWF